VALRCLETTILSGGYRFNYMRGVEMKLALESWVSAEEIHERIDELAGNEEYGDVLARRTE
jgi:hypothetical protein